MTNVQLRTLLQDSLTAGLTLQEYRAFVAVLIKTVGYGKDSDDIATSQLVDLTGVRGDKIRPASKALVDKGLFSRKKGTYGFVFTLSEQYRDNSIRFDTSAEHSKPEKQEVSDQLVYPTTLSEVEVKKANKELKVIPVARQQVVLDALNARIELGGVRSNIAMLKSLIAAEKQGYLIEPSVPEKEKPQGAHLAAYPNTLPLEERERLAEREHSMRVSKLMEAAQ